MAFMHVTKETLFIIHLVVLWTRDCRKILSFIKKKSWVATMNLNTKALAKDKIKINNT